MLLHDSTFWVRNLRSAELEGHLDLRAKQYLAPDDMITEETMIALFIPADWLWKHTLSAVTELELEERPCKTA